MQLKKRLNRCSRFGLGAHNLTNRIQLHLPEEICYLSGSSNCVLLYFFLVVFVVLCISFAAHSYYLFFSFVLMCFVFARIWTLQVLQMFVRFYACSLPSQSFSFYIFAFIQWIFNDNVVETSSRLLVFFGKYIPACFLFRQCLKQEINHRFERVFLLILLVDKMSLACNFFLFALRWFFLI